jgi:hypothetical protein
VNPKVVQEVAIYAGFHDVNQTKTWLNSDGETQLSNLGIKYLLPEFKKAEERHFHKKPGKVPRQKKKLLRCCLN